jgi:hypothetical protein
METNFEKWWDETGSGIIPQKDDDMESHAKRVAKQAILEMNEQLFVKNKTITNMVILGDNKKPDNYRAEGWYQYSNKIKQWLNS